MRKRWIHNAIGGLIVGIGIAVGIAFATVTGTYTPSRVSTDGNTTEFSFDFKVPAQGDLVVQLLNGTTLAATNQTLGSNYTVSLSKSTPGGTVTFLSAPAAGQYVQLYREVDATQPTDIPSGGLLREVQIENALDRNVLLIQQLQEQTDRCLKVAIGETVPEDYLGDAETAAAEAQGYANITLGYANDASASAAAAAASAESIDFSKDNSTDLDGESASDDTVPTQLAVRTFVNSRYPIGCIYTTTVATNPATVLGFGTWEAFGEGRVLVGKASSGTFSTANATGGVENVTLTAAQSGLPGHAHPLPYGGLDSGGGTGGYVEPPYNTATCGGTSGQSGIYNAAAAASEAHTNLQPYIVVYYWIRTA